MPRQLVRERALTRTYIARNGEVLDVLHGGKIVLPGSEERRKSGEFTPFESPNQTISESRGPVGMPKAVRGPRRSRRTRSNIEESS